MTCPARRPRAVAVIVTAFVTTSLGAQQVQPAPAFDVAYRAWEIVTEMARQNRDPSIGGDCAKTFRPFVIPGLRQQSRQDQDVAASTCVAAAKSACANKALRRDADVAKKCGEFQ